MEKVYEIFGLLSYKLKKKTILILLFSIIVFFIEMLEWGITATVKNFNRRRFCYQLTKISRIYKFIFILRFIKLNLSDQNTLKFKLIIGGCSIIVITF